MSATAQDIVTEALRATAPRPGDSADDIALTELAELVALTALIEQLNERARLHLAPRPTVTSHLVQAHEHLAGLRRTLTHATETLAYNTARRSPLAVVS